MEYEQKKIVVLGCEAFVNVTPGGWKKTAFKTKDEVYVNISYYAACPRTCIHASVAATRDCPNRTYSVDIDTNKECGDAEVLRAINAVRLLRGDKI